MQYAFSLMMVSALTFVAFVGVRYRRNQVAQQPSNLPKKSEASLLQQILYHAPYMAIYYDIDCRCRFISKPKEGESGLVFSLGRTPLDEASLFYNEEMASQYQRMLCHSMVTGSEQTFKCTLKMASGQFEEMFACTCVVKQSLDTTDGVIVYLSAKPSYQTSIEQLEANLHHLHAVFDNIPDPVYVKDESGLLVLMNRAGKVLFERLGGNRDNLSKTPANVRLPWEPNINSLNDIDGLPEHNEQIIKLSSDEILAVSNIQSKFVFENKQRLIIGVCRDVSEYVKLQTVLYRKEQEFRTLSENAPVIIVRYDLQLKRVYVNPFYNTYTGLTNEEALGKTPTQAWAFNMSAREYEGVLREVILNQKKRQIILEKSLSDGFVKMLDVQIVPEYDQSNNIVGCLTIAHDITELKRTEIELVQSKAQLQKLYASRELAREQERKRIAREIHDELGQLLSLSRLNFSEIDYLYSSRIPELTPKIQRAVSHIDTAISTVRKLSKSLLPVGLDNGVALAITSMVNDFTETTGIHHAIMLPDSPIYLSDEAAIMVFRVVQESLTNILRHAEATQVIVEMSIANESLITVVQDNGRGFAQPNFGFSKSLGITGMHERAALLGGHLEILSEMDKGTSVKLRIPYYFKAMGEMV